MAGLIESVSEALLAYAQILFSRSRVVGGLLLLATALSPWACLGGVLGVASATAAAWLLGLDPAARRDGTYGYNALLIGLGIGEMWGGGAPLRALALLLLFCPASALLTAALRAWLTPSGLPVLSWPFLLLFALVPGVAGLAGLPAGAVEAAGAAEIWAPLDLFLRGLGALFFLPRPSAGAVLLLALLVHSRIAVVLAASAFALSYAACAHLSGGTAILPSLGYNGALIALALGGVWFVPSPSSFALALGGVALSGMVAAGALAPLSRLGLPVGVLPFNAALWLVLLAMRQRAYDQRPKAVDFLPGTPEENLGYYRTRLQRFRWLYAVKMRLPFRGTWVCTQGVDGPFTHKERWRHAYDFEVRGSGGLLFREDGSLPEHYHAYRLPVLAAAPGVVVKVVGQVPDNPVGDLNLAENWGNLVLIQHGPALYSMVAHLLPGSIKVYEGQPVRQGDVLGLCGNSGRSPQPHIHFHLQATARIGDATIPCRFNDVVLSGASERVEKAASPGPGEEVRNLVPGEEAAMYLGSAAGEAWAGSFRVGGAVERVACEVDVLGRRLLRSRDKGALLYFELGEDFFTVYDVVGARGSLLHLLRAALPRVPLEINEALRWRDHLPGRPFRAFYARVLGDFLAPFLGDDGIEVEYRAQRQGALLTISGESLARDRSGAPLLRTRAELLPGGLKQVEVTVRGRSAGFVRCPPEAQMAHKDEIKEVSGP